MGIPIKLVKAIFRDLGTGHVFHERFSRAPVTTYVSKIGEKFLATCADDLVAQGVDNDGSFLSTRGYNLYRFNGENQFDFYCRLPCPIGLGQALRFPSLRKLVGKRDIVQLFYTTLGTLIVQSGGCLFRRKANESTFRKVFRLRHWGRSGRGILYNGMEQGASGRLFLGEYFQNPSRVPVRIYSSDDDGLSWNVLQEFPAGAIRHIHAIHQDPFGDGIWVCAGDTDEESRILKSHDDGETFEVVGSGSQAWRCCTLLFDEKAIYWGADTESGVDCRYLYRFNRADGSLHRLEFTDGAIEFALEAKPDLQLYATTRVGYGEVPDGHASIIVKKPDRQSMRIRLGTRIDSSKGCASGAKMYYSSVLEQVCLSFTNIVQLDGKVAIIPVSVIRGELERQLPHASTSQGLSSGPSQVK